MKVNGACVRQGLGLETVLYAAAARLHPSSVDWSHSEQRQRQMQKQSTNQRQAEQDERHLRAASRDRNHKLTYSSRSNGSRKRRSQDGTGFKFYWCKLHASRPVISFQPSCVRVIWATTGPTPTPTPIPLCNFSCNSVAAAWFVLCAAQRALRRIPVACALNWKLLASW